MTNSSARDHLHVARAALQARVEDLEPWKGQRPAVVADLLGVKEFTVRQAVRDGAPCERVGGRGTMHFYPTQILALWEHIFTSRSADRSSTAVTAAPAHALSAGSAAAQRGARWTPPCSPADRMSVQTLLALRQRR